MILGCKFQILGIKTTVGHYIIIFFRNSSCLSVTKADETHKDNVTMKHTSYDIVIPIYA